LMTGGMICGLNPLNKQTPTLSFHFLWVHWKVWKQCKELGLFRHNAFHRNDPTMHSQESIRREFPCAFLKQSCFNQYWGRRFESALWPLLTEMSSTPESFLSLIVTLPSFVQWLSDWLGIERNCEETFQGNDHHVCQGIFFAKWLLSKSIGIFFAMGVFCCHRFWCLIAFFERIF
jgi:hypothetical protein